MSKPLTQKTITISEIFEAITKHGVTDARKMLAGSIGASLKEVGAIQKIIKREGRIKLLLQTDSMKVFADFGTNADFLLHVKKGQKVAIAGSLQSFGFESVCLNQCRIEGTIKENKN